MKIIFLIICLPSIFITSLFAQNRDEVVQILKDPQPYLNSIRGEIKDGEKSWESDQKLADRIRGLAYSINQEIISAEAKDWGNPSHARLEIIQKWGVTLEPYTKELLSLAFEERATRENSSTQARSILDFASPTEQFERHVRYYMSESKPIAASAAAFLLYEHRLLTNDDINILRAVISSMDKLESKRLALIGLSFYGATDGIAIAQEILRSGPKSSSYEKLIAQYRDALDLIQNLGPAAESLLPDLDALMSKIRRVQLKESERGILIKLQYSRDLLTEKQSMQERLAANGSGPLTVKIGDLPQRKIQDDASKKDASLERPEKRHASSASKSSDVPAKKTASWPWGIIISFIFLLVVALVAWLKMRKAKSTS